MLSNLSSPLKAIGAQDSTAALGRQIPDTHLLRLPGIRSTGTLSVDEYRRDILLPIHDYLRTHGLEEEIDLIAYSGDFPYAVDFTADLKDNEVERSTFVARDKKILSVASDIGGLDGLVEKLSGTGDLAIDAPEAGSLAAQKWG